jgi:hypothetical protein
MNMNTVFVGSSGGALLGFGSYTSLKTAIHFSFQNLIDGTSSGIDIMTSYCRYLTNSYLEFRKKVITLSFESCTRTNLFLVQFYIQEKTDVNFLVI